jgi:hypothetical protein
MNTMASSCHSALDAESSAFVSWIPAFAGMTMNELQYLYSEAELREILLIKVITG